MLKLQGIVKRQIKPFKAFLVFSGLCIGQLKKFPRNHRKRHDTTNTTTTKKQRRKKNRPPPLGATPTRALNFDFHANMLQERSVLPLHPPFSSGMYPRLNQVRLKKIEKQAGFRSVKNEVFSMIPPKKLGSVRFFATDRGFSSQIFL